MTAEAPLLHQARANAVSSLLRPVWSLEDVFSPVDRTPASDIYAKDLTDDGCVAYLMTIRIDGINAELLVS